MKYEKIINFKDPWEILNFDHGKNNVDKREWLSDKHNGEGGSFDGVIKASNQALELRDSLLVEIDAEIDDLQMRKGDMVVGYQPGKKRDLGMDTARQLYEQNHETVSAKLDSLLETEDLDVAIDGLMSVLPELSRWRNPGKMNFLGLRPHTFCNMDLLPKRCLYCSQDQYKGSVLSKKIIINAIDQTTDHGKRSGVIMSMSGGEVLQIYKNRMDDFLEIIEAGSSRGAVMNINSNMHGLTTEIAYGLVESGLAKVRVSLDSNDPATNGVTRGGEDSLEKTMRGIITMQRVKERMGVKFPIIHINTVVTNKNLKLLPELFSFLLALREPVSKERAQSSKRRGEFLRKDLAPVLLLIQDSENSELFLNREDWELYYGELLPKMMKIWSDYEDGLGVRDEYKATLEEFADSAFFGDPLSRFGGDMNALVSASERGVYNDNEKLPRTCYALGTQMYVMPEGRVYPCGGRAESRHLLDKDDSPTLDLSSNSIERSEEAIILNLSEKPLSIDSPDCENCYGSAVRINNRAEKFLNASFLWLIAQSAKGCNWESKMLEELLAIVDAKFSEI